MDTKLYDLKGNEIGYLEYIPLRARTIRKHHSELAKLHGCYSCYLKFHINGKYFQHDFEWDPRTGNKHAVYTISRRTPGHPRKFLGEMTKRERLRLSKKFKKKLTGKRLEEYNRFTKLLETSSLRVFGDLCRNFKNLSLSFHDSAGRGIGTMEEGLDLYWEAHIQLRPRTYVEIGNYTFRDRCGVDPKKFKTISTDKATIFFVDRKFHSPAFE
jgi:hypothetical protein